MNASHQVSEHNAYAIHEMKAPHGTVVSEYGGDPSRVWTDATDADDLRRRIEALPGFGEMKVKALGSVLAKRFGVAAAQGLVPGHPTLGDVDSIEALEDYQAKKRAYKASLRGAR